MEELTHSEHHLYFSHLSCAYTKYLGQLCAKPHFSGRANTMALEQIFEECDSVNQLQQLQFQANKLSILNMCCRRVATKSAHLQNQRLIIKHKEESLCSLGRINRFVGGPPKPPPPPKKRKINKSYLMDVLLHGNIVNYIYF